MSGVEVAGLVLGALPLLLSTLEHYDVILEPIIKYRKFSSKIRDLHDTLSLERTIFRAECVLLLSPYIARTEAEAMLADPAHRLWRNEAFNRRMDQCFGSLGHAMKEVIGSMVAAMAKISMRLKDFDAMTGIVPTRSSSSDENWRSSIRTKLKFALSSHASMSKDLESLTRLNERFITLSSQIRQLESSWTPLDNIAPKHKSSGNDLRGFEQTRMASIDLFGALLYPCSHHHHFLRIALNGIYAKPESVSVLPGVRFDIRYCSCDIRLDDVLDSKTQTATAATMYKHEYRLLIESSSILDPNNSIQSSPSVENAASKEISDNPATVSAAMTAMEISDRGHTDSLCHHLTRSVGLASHSSTLRERGVFKHTLLSNSPVAWSDSKVSLADLLNHVKKSGKHFEIPQYQRLYIAETLGSRVLQMHGTPWLPHTPNSNDLYFFGELGDVSENTTLGYTEFEPDKLYVDIELDPNNAKSLVDTSGATSSTMATSRLSRFGIQIGPANSWLYHLGILLIELAYHISFTDLVAELKDEYQALGIPLSSHPPTAEYQLACQLAENIGSTLGAKYARIVRKCLKCDFGVTSSDLGDNILQQAVYQDVILPLREMESGFRTLQMESAT